MGPIEALVLSVVLTLLIALGVDIVIVHTHELRQTRRDEADWKAVRKHLK